MKSSFINELSAGCIDEIGGALHLLELRKSHHLPCFWGESGMDGDEVRFLKQLVKLYRFHLQCLKENAGYVGGVGNDSQVKSSGFWDKGAGYISKADKP